MVKTITQLLNNQGGNYILPFFWQHGEDEATLREYMGVINDCGIRAVCIEARPHPDYAGPKWWTDMDIIMDEARKRGMKVWLLDDAHFPTGFANGALTNADPSLCKQYVNVHSADVCGPLPAVELDIATMAKTVPSPFGDSGMGMPGRSGSKTRIFDDDSLLCVVASKLVEGLTVDDTLLELTSIVMDGKLVWDVPDGMWRIFVFYDTRNGGGRTDYINIIDEDSCRVQINAVYEPHYAHYKDDFGKTFAGFFSDEPLIGNTTGYQWNDSIGRKQMPLPWNKDVPVMLEARLGADWKKLLPALWTDVGENDLTAKVRYAYMDTVTRLVEQNFSNQLGNWCSEHGVEYIGHLIEDNNQHSRLGCSLGHYFRGLAGQHMAGIDDIGNQVLLGGENHFRVGGFSGPSDGEFYHFALGKLASSHAHIDPKKQGRAMCEIFGAYGWNTGVRLMKWLTDHFLVRGINQYVPHAFSPKAFPDADCPPHFYAHGHNPQYRHFQLLMRYMNRMCHIFNNGTHIAPAAVLYHGEAEWTGEYMYVQKVARQLMENQVDFDIIPSDLFADMNSFNASYDSALNVNGETYRALIIPYAEYISTDVAKFAAKATASGYDVIFIDALPSGIYDQYGDNLKDDTTASLIKGLNQCAILPTSTLAAYLRNKGKADVSLSAPFKHLRYYRYSKEGQDAYMFSNEHAGNTFEGDITVASIGTAYLYDAMENVVRPVFSETSGVGTKLHLKLEPYESAVVIFGEVPADLKLAPVVGGSKQILSGDWALSLAESLAYPNFTDVRSVSKLESVGKMHPDFSGFMRYEKTFDLSPEKVTVLEIEDAYEGVEVWVNEKYAGMKICPPYRFDISEQVVCGQNSLRIEVANTLDRAVRAMGTDRGMAFMRGSSIVSPSGIVGNVSVYTY